MVAGVTPAPPARVAATWPLTGSLASGPEGPAVGVDLGQPADWAGQSLTVGSHWTPLTGQPADRLLTS